MIIMRPAIYDHHADKSSLVGVGGFEPPTSRSRTVRSTKLSHTPIRKEENCGA